MSSATERKEALQKLAELGRNDIGATLADRIKSARAAVPRPMSADGSVPAAEAKLMNRLIPPILSRINARKSDDRLVNEIDHCCKSVEFSDRRFYPSVAAMEILNAVLPDESGHYQGDRDEWSPLCVNLLRRNGMGFAVDNYHMFAEIDAVLETQSRETVERAVLDASEDELLMWIDLVPEAVVVSRFKDLKPWQQHRLIVAHGAHEILSEHDLDELNPYVQALIREISPEAIDDYRAGLLPQ